MSTNSREIKYQNSEKSLSLIIERLVSMAKKNLMSLFSLKHFAIVVGPEYISWHKIRTIGPVVWPVHREQTDKCSRQTNRGDQYTLQKSTILQSNKQTWALQYLALPLWGGEVNIPLYERI